MIKISFVIPAYNAQDTIVRTLDSIYALPLKPEEMEVIVIDDASTDKTVAVIEDLKSKIANLVLFRQPVNQRQGAARNRGLKEVKGLYVAFVDSDDLVMPGMAKALQYAIETEVDMLHCGMTIERGGKERNVIARAPKNEVMSAHEFCEKWHTVETCQSPCSYLYKNAFLQRSAIPFMEGKRLEDTDWVEKHLFAAETIAGVEDVIYKYMENTTSTMHTTRFDTCADWLHFSYRRLKFANEIKGNAPLYAERLIEAGRWGVLANTTYRRLTRFAPMDFWRIRERCGKECIAYLAAMKWNGFTRIVFKMPFVAFMSLCAARPVTVAGRAIVQGIRMKIK
jgi:glycosyltransferase involved in cell wall biosynthesis